VPEEQYRAVTAPADPHDITHYITAHTTAADFDSFVLQIPFGPSRCRAAALRALGALIQHITGNTSFLTVVEDPTTNLSTRPTQFQFTDEDAGTSTLATLVQEHNPFVCAIATEDQRLFLVVHRVTYYPDDDIDGEEIVTLEGTFRTNEEAETRALAVFRRDTEGEELEERDQYIREDRILECETFSVEQGAWRRTSVEVLRGFRWEQD
ncbi:MAG: hypothetical protein LQ350_008559, partial [Teloschistes chrysophthalmus]